MKNRFFIWIILLFCVLSISCKDKRVVEAEKIVKEWTGKTIRFPEGVKCKIMGNDTICAELFEKPYKVLVYVDSAGCTSCKLRMSDWKKIISEIDSIEPQQVSFLFFFNPKNERELDFLMKRESFEHPIFIDNSNTIDKLNHFPNNMMYQSFLLDKDNKVLSVGNPSMNPKVWELYKQFITGEKSLNNVPLTTVEIENKQLTLEGLSVGKKTKAHFLLTNTGAVPLVINDVKSSCGCTVPSWEKRPVKPGSKVKIDIEIEPETTGFFNKTVDVYCNIESGVIHFSMTGIVY